MHPERVVLATLWLGFFSLGSPKYESSTQIAFSLIVLASISLLLMQAFMPNFAQTRSKRFAPWAVILLGASFATQLLSAYLNSYDIAGELAGLLTVGFGFIAATRSSTESLLRSFYTSSIIFLALGWIVELTIRSRTEFESGFSFNLLGRRFTGLAVHPNVMGLLCALLFALALIKYGNRGVATFSLVTLLLTENRGGILAVASILVIWALSSRKGSQRIFAVSSLAFLGVSIAVLFGSLREGANDLTSGRLDIWSVCQNKIEQGHLFGFGPNTIARVYGVDTVDWFRPFHCHNQFLDDSVNFGLITGILNLIGLMAIFVINAKKRSYVFAAIFATFISVSLFESPIRLFASAGFLWINFFFLVFYLSAAREGQSSLPEFEK